MPTANTPPPQGALWNLLTEKYKRVQDAHLDRHIHQLRNCGALAEYRAWAAFQDIHRRLRVLREQTIAACLAADSLAPAVQGPNVFDAYMGLVLAMARAGDDRPFIPVEFWPSAPPPYPYTPEARMGLQAIVNLARERVGLFTEHKLLVNRHYAVLLAHLLVCPDEIDHAGQIPPPYPWPFVIRLDSEGTPSLDVQPDIPRELPDLARNIAAALHGSLRQAGPLPYGALAKSLKTRDAPPRCAHRPMSPEHLKVAKVACDLLDADPYRTLKDVLENPEFRYAQIQCWGEVRINSESTLSGLLKRYRELTGRKKTPRRREQPMR